MKRELFGNYELIEQIGQGVTAEVFRAKPRSADEPERFVALKRMHHTWSERQRIAARFAAEAALGAKLHHRNIVKMLDAGEVSGRRFIAMEFIHGRTLHALIRRQWVRCETVPIGYACYMLMKLCAALDHLHRACDDQGNLLHAVHGDVSLANILVSFGGDVKLIDFGSAKSGHEQSTELAGEFGYMAPERLRGQPCDKRADMFSCGVILFELITGRRLFFTDNADEILQSIRDRKLPRPSAYNPAIPTQLDHIVYTALSEDPRERYQNAAELGVALRVFAERYGLRCRRPKLATWARRLFLAEYMAELDQLAASIKPTPMRTRTVTPPVRDTQPQPAIELLGAALVHDTPAEPVPALVAAPAPLLAAAAEPDARDTLVSLEVAKVEMIEMESVGSAPVSQIQEAQATEPGDPDNPILLTMPKRAKGWVDDELIKTTPYHDRKAERRSPSQRFPITPQTQDRAASA